MKTQATTSTWKPLSSSDCAKIDGGVKATYDENGEIIADCEGRYVTLFGGTKIWVPHGTIVFTADGPR